MAHRRNQAGRTLMIGLPGTALDRTTFERVRDLGPGGVILFGRNLESPEQTRRLLDDVRRAAGRPLLSALDQEGGRVSRLRPWVGDTPAATVLARAGIEATAGFARATARGLRALGFNLDFAPVVDLSLPEATNGIGDRSFGTDAERVTALAGAFLAGLQGAGVAGCLKHFPGLGSTSVDSHQALPVDGRDSATLRGRDLLPFARLAAHSACVMVGHGSYPAFDPGPPTPATLSPMIVGALLRGELGFSGLVASDDMEMGAVAGLDEDGQAAVRAIGAGCDLLLYCASLERAERAALALERAAADDAAFARRLEAAAAAVERETTRWPGEPDLAGWESARSALAGFRGLA